MKRRSAGIGLFGIAMFVMAGGCASERKVAKEIETHIEPALYESFEVPHVENYAAYSAGQSFRTIDHTWQVESGGVGLFDASRREIPVADGTQALELASEAAGPGVISTPFATTPGQAYNLTFDFARDRRVDPGTARARVEVLGPRMLLQADFQHAPATQPFDSLDRFEDRFVAEATETTLRFRGLSPGKFGMAIDAIVIRPEETKPAPSAP